MQSGDPRIILVDTVEKAREVLAARLRMQGYQVEISTDAAAGAHAALTSPPAAVVADLWMPGISGVQLCRLLKAEPATQGVPVILRGPAGQRDRFWAERAGASEYVPKGRMGDLVRALSRTIGNGPKDDFFIDLRGSNIDIRDRIAEHLDTALFDSVLAAEVRALSSSTSFARLFDLLSQFVTQVTSYRWLAVTTQIPEHLALHTHPAARERSLAEAVNVLKLPPGVHTSFVEDDDAQGIESGPEPLLRPILFGKETIGRICLAFCEDPDEADHNLVEVIARELGGPIRISLLVEESQRMARIDSLTGLMNRRAFIPELEMFLARLERYGGELAILLIDIDHFKAINDTRGHASGDAVLSAVGRMLNNTLRVVDVTGRWGGEEFVVALPETGTDGGRIAAERMRSAFEGLVVLDAKGEPIRVTASIGVSTYRKGDTAEALVDRADRAMYQAKSNGRNRVSMYPCQSEVPNVRGETRTKTPSLPPSVAPVSSA